MKIAYILPSLANKGPVLIAKYIIDNLVKEGNSVHVYYFDNDCELSFPCETSIIKFREAIDFSIYDIIHTHQLRPDLYVWYHKRRIPKYTKIVSTVHQEIYKSLKYEFGVSPKTFIGTILWKLALNKADRVVVLNNSMKRQFSNSLVKNVIGNGIPNPQNIQDVESEDIEILNDFKLRNKGRTVLGVAALLISRKGIDQIIKSLPNLPNYSLLVIGDGDEKKKLEKLALKLGVADRCLFLGFRQQGFRYFKYFDIYMLTSHSEGFPICSIEAAMFGLPIVASNIDVLKDIYTENEVSFYNLNDILDLERAVRYAYERKAEYSLSILNKFKKSLSSKVMSDNYFCLYNELIHKR